MSPGHDNYVTTWQDVVISDPSRPSPGFSVDQTGFTGYLVMGHTVIVTNSPCPVIYQLISLCYCQGFSTPFLLVLTCRPVAITFLVCVSKHAMLIIIWKHDTWQNKTFRHVLIICYNNLDLKQWKEFKRGSIFFTYVLIPQGISYHCILTGASLVFYMDFHLKDGTTTTYNLISSYNDFQTRLYNDF